MARRQVKATFGIREDKENANVWRMLKWTWMKRFKKIQEQLVHRSAETLLSSVQKKIPNTKANKDYKRALGISSVKGFDSDVNGVAITARPKKRSTRGLDPELTLVYVRALRKPVRQSPQLTVLIEHSPWTLPGIPFMPKKGDALLTYRKVSAREVLAIGKRRQNEKRVWTQALRKAGLKSSDQQRKLFSGGRRGQAYEDMAFTALRLEQGQGGDKPSPHWRPSVSSLKSSGIKSIMRDRTFGRAVSDPGFKSWASWPKRSRNKPVPKRDLKQFGMFQKKLGVKW